MNLQRNSVPAPIYAVAKGRPPGGVVLGTNGKLEGPRRSGGTVAIHMTSRPDTSSARSRTAHTLPYTPGAARKPLEAAAPDTRDGLALSSADPGTEGWQSG